MYPQSELDNYKLQVELLQEKLKTSEQRRQQLEDKFENLMRKRKEHERMLRAKNRLKHEQFLREQSERNERNRSLIRALERIDQQASTLAARSERLKILKVQYELYFDKILQFRTMRNALFNYNNYAHPTTPLPFPAQLSHHHYPTSDFDPTPAMRREFYLTPGFLDDGNHESMSELDSYRRRHDDTINVPKDTIVSSSGAILHRYPQQQFGEVNFRPNVKDVIATTGSSSSTMVAGISSSPDPYNQRNALFADTRTSIDSNRCWSEDDPKAMELRSGSHAGDGGMMSRPNIAILKSDRPRSPAQNRFNDTADNYGRTYEHDGSYTGYEQSPSNVNKPRQPFTLDKSHPINRDEALGRLLTKLYDNKGDNDESGREKSSGEKSQPIAEGRNMFAMKDEIESQSTEKVTDNNTSSGKDMSGSIGLAPSLHNSRLEKSGKDHFPNNIKKREKLSIETIENAIYGERISPTTPSLGDGKLNLDRLRQTLSENLKIDSRESVEDMGAQDEKFDENVAVVTEEESILPKPELINDEIPTADVSGPVENPVTEDFNQPPTEPFDSNNENGQESVKPIEEIYNVDNSGNYNAEQYQGEMTNYPDASQYGYEGQEQSYEQYQYDQSQEQSQSVYDPSQNPDQMYYQTGQEGQNYDMSQDMSYQQYPEGSYDPNQPQYDVNDQSYGNAYSGSEYDPNIQATDSTNIADPSYNYEQQPDGTYDPNLPTDQQYYPDASQDYYQYSDPNQYGTEGFDTNQTGEYADPSQVSNFNPESGPMDPNMSAEAVQPITDTTAPEISEMQQPTPEEVLTTSADPPPEPVKPTSILSGSEKSQESGAAAGKNKKKKRVIFAENETEESSSKSDTSAQKPDQQATSGRSSSNVNATK